MDRERTANEEERFLSSLFTPVIFTTVPQRDKLQFSAPNYSSAKLHRNLQSPQRSLARGNLACCFPAKPKTAMTNHNTTVLIPTRSTKRYNSLISSSHSSVNPHDKHRSSQSLLHCHFHLLPPHRLPKRRAPCAIHRGSPTHTRRHAPWPPPAKPPKKRLFKNCARLVTKGSLASTAIMSTATMTLSMTTMEQGHDRTWTL